MLGLTALQFFFGIIVVFTITYWIFPNKIKWVSFVIMVALLGVLAFHIEPGPTDDLSLYFKYISSFHEEGFDACKSAIEDNAFDWKTYRMCAYYFYLVSLIGDVHWLPAITVMFSYGTTFLMIEKTSKRFEIDKKWTFFASMFFISTYWLYDLASGIRNGFAFAIVMICAYYHLVERKRIPLCYAGYVIACLCHSAGIVMVAVVVVAALTLNSSGKFVSIILVTGFALGGYLMRYLSSFSDSDYVQNVAERTSRFSVGTIGRETNYYVNIATVLVVLLIVWYAAPFFTTGRYAKELKRLYKFSSSVCLFLIGGVATAPMVFMRVTRWVVPVIGALVFMLAMQIQVDLLEGKVKRDIYDEKSKDIALRFRIRPFVIGAYVLFSIVHMWYSFNGSSMIYMYFADEWV